MSRVTSDVGRPFPLTRSWSPSYYLDFVGKDPSVRFLPGLGSLRRLVCGFVPISGSLFPGPHFSPGSVMPSY